MGFPQVFGYLKEIFPQVDRRVLRSVAIEHPRDANDAADFIINEVLPLMNEKSEESNSFHEKQTIKELTVSRDFETEACINAFDADLSISKHFRSSNMGKNKDHLSKTLNKHSDRTASVDEPAEDVSISAHSSAAHLMPHKPDFTSHLSSLKSNCLDASSSSGISLAYSLEDTTAFKVADNKDTVDICVHKVPNLGAFSITSGDNVNAENLSSSTSGKCPDTFQAESNLVSDVKNCPSESQEKTVGCAVSHDLDFATQASSMNSNCLDAKTSCGFFSEDLGVELLEVLSSDESESVISIEDTSSLHQDIADNDNASVNIVIPKITNLGVDSTCDSHGNTESFSLSTSGKPLDITNMVNYSSEPQGQPLGCAVDDADMQYHDGLAAPSLRSADCSNALISSENKESTDFTQCYSIIKGVRSSIGEYEKPPRFSSDTGAELLSFETDMVFVEANNISTEAIQQLAQLPKIDIIEEYILDARDNKKTLASSMGFILDMMKEVEDAEAKTAKTIGETQTAGQDTVVKVEELKWTLKHAKEANEMHAGEVYGEMSILASEARELQSRLLSLSDERDRLHSTINEVRQTLVERLAAAKEGLAVAEQEKNWKEEFARKALEDQEHNMETIVEESKKLQQLEEENLKLKVFLVDRGHIVDTLKGEMAVICEDVCSLKQKVDNCIPFNRLTSLRSSLISSASSSHQRSMP